MRHQQLAHPGPTAWNTGPVRAAGSGQVEGRPLCPGTNIPRFPWTPCPAPGWCSVSASDARLHRKTSLSRRTMRVCQTNGSVP
jgi:hypothetical protein